MYTYLYTNASTHAPSGCGASCLLDEGIGITAIYNSRPGFPCRPTEGIRFYGIRVRGTRFY